MDIKGKLSVTDSRRSSLINTLSAKGASLHASAGLSLIPSAIMSIQGGPTYDDILRGNFSELGGSASFIASHAFEGCSNLTSISFPNCKSVGDLAFIGCTSLSSVTVPLCEHIGSYAFTACASIPSISIGRVKTIGEYAFMNCTSLSSVRMAACESIGSYAFDFCTSLSYVNLPNIKTISNYAFAYCTGLMRVRLMGSQVVSTNNVSTVFDNTPIYAGEGKIIVPDSLYYSYKNDPNWGSYQYCIYPQSEESE